MLELDLLKQIIRSNVLLVFIPLIISFIRNQIDSIDLYKDLSRLSFYSMIYLVALTTAAYVGFELKADELILTAVMLNVIISVLFILFLFVQFLARNRAIKHYVIFLILLLLFCLVIYSSSNRYPDYHYSHLLFVQLSYTFLMLAITSYLEDSKANKRLVGAPRTSFSFCFSWIKDYSVLITSIFILIFLLSPALCISKDFTKIIASGKLHQQLFTFSYFLISVFFILIVAPVIHRLFNLLLSTKPRSLLATLHNGKKLYGAKLQDRGDKIVLFCSDGKQIVLNKQYVVWWRKK